MTVKLGTKLTTFKRIVYNLWILASFIPMINGWGLSTLELRPQIKVRLMKV